MDRRLTPATDRMAHHTLIGQVDGRTFTEGEPLSVSVPLVDLLSAPDGGRERQLWLGDQFTVIDRDRDHAFGFAAKDGYCGWVPEAALAPPTASTHWVAAPASHVYAGPKVQAPNIAALPMGARLPVTALSGAFAETPLGFVPVAHLRPIGQWHDDPVTVAEMFLGTPYLWGGNGHEGLDCSGLVQVAHLACGRACPADSDLQQAVGQPLDDGAVLQRGDLLFWKGHVALVVGAARLIHANAHSMSVAYEPIAACVARIAQQGGGAVTCRRRP